MLYSDLSVVLLFTTTVIYQATAVTSHCLAPGFEILECGEWPDATNVASTHVVAAFHRTSSAQHDGRQLWEDQVLSIVFKSCDPDDDGHDDEADHEQIISNAELCFAVQQRVALFTLVVLGSQLCFVRWDRSGAVVTMPLDYVEN